MSDPASELLKLVVGEVALRHGYASAEFGDEVVLSGPHRVVLTLPRLQRRVARAPQQLWPTLVGDQLELQLAELSTAQAELACFRVARPLLRTWLSSVHATGLTDDVRRLVAPGLLQRLLIDHGDLLTPVTYDRARDWDISEFELFEIAEANTGAEEVLELMAADIEGVDEANVQMLYGATDYVSAHVRWLDRYPVLGPWGALVVLPGRTHILAHPINGRNVLAAATVLAQLLVASEAHSHPLSRIVYWWRNRFTIEVAATLRGGAQVEIIPSYELELLLEKMRAA